MPGAFTVKVRLPGWRRVLPYASVRDDLERVGAGEKPVAACESPPEHGAERAGVSAAG